MDNNLLDNLSEEALEDLLYSKNWKDLEVISIDVEPGMKLTLEWRDLTDIDDKVHYDAYNTLKIYTDESGLHVDHLWDYTLWYAHTVFTYSPDVRNLFINYLLENGPQLIYDFAESIEYLDKKESRY